MLARPAPRHGDWSQPIGLGQAILPTNLLEVRAAAAAVGTIIWQGEALPMALLHDACCSCVASPLLALPDS